MNALEVTATFHGGYAATVEARGHTIAVDEPVDAGGEDDGVMPTELLCASLASCFASRSPTWRAATAPSCRGCASTSRAERAGRELRYGRMRRLGAAPTCRLRAATWRARRRLCWVSNTLAPPPPEIEYRTEDS